MRKSSKSQSLLRKVIRENLLRELTDDRFINVNTNDPRFKFPEPETGFITKMAFVLMKWKHRTKLLETFDSWETNVRLTADGFDKKIKKERLEAFESLRKEIKNPVTYIKNADKGSQYWTGLAYLVSKESQGEVMGQRLDYRQGLVDEVLEDIEEMMIYTPSSQFVNEKLVKGDNIKIK